MVVYIDRGVQKWYTIKMLQHLFFPIILQEFRHIKHFKINVLYFIQINLKIHLYYFITPSTFKLL